MRTEHAPPPANWQGLQHHALSAQVGFEIGLDMDALVASMREHGYDEAEPVILYEGKILDGRHRHSAAIRAGCIPSFRRFTGPDPVAFVSKKILRQHLSDDQRALLGALLAGLRKGANQHPPAGGPSQRSRQQAAQAVNVSVRSLDRAKAVVTQGAPEVTQAVQSGTVSLSDAAKVVAAPKAVQKAAIKSVAQGEAETASQAIAMYCARCQRVGPVYGCRECQSRRKATHQPSRPSARPGINEFSILINRCIGALPKYGITGLQAEGLRRKLFEVKEEVNRSMVRSRKDPK